jgi:hypothetical protein
MATTTKTPAKTTPAKAPAKAAPAKAAATKAPAEKRATTNLRWRIVKEYEKGKEQQATAGDREYSIERNGESWRATLKVGKKKTLLVELGTFGRCYSACVHHNREAQAKA